MQLNLEKQGCFLLFLQVIITLKIVKKQTKFLLEKFYKDNGFPDAKIISSNEGLKMGIVSILDLFNL